MRPVTVTLSMADPDDREVEVRARYTPATSDYFDGSFGNWLPGDPEDVEVLSARAVDEGADVAAVEKDEDRILEAARLAAHEPCPIEEG